MQKFELAGFAAALTVAGLLVGWSLPAKRPHLGSHHHAAAARP